MFHCERARLVLDREMAVIGAAYRDPVVARRRLDPHILESGLAHDLAVGDAVQRDAAGDTQVLGSGGLAQPPRPREQHLLGVVLHAPGHVLPMLHGRARLPVLAAVHQRRRLELVRPVVHFQVAAVELDEAPDALRPAIGREPHQLTALVPVAEHIRRGAAISRSQPRHVVELVAQHAAARLHEDLLQGLDPGAVEFVIALRFAGERRRLVGRRIGLVDIGTVAADAVDHHHHPFVERAYGEGAVGVRQMVRDRHHLVRLRQVERILGRLRTFIDAHERRHVLVDEAPLHLLDRHDVAIAHDEIDVVEQDALGIEAIVDDFLEEAARMLLARDPFLCDGERDLAVAQEAGADVMVVGVQSKYVGMFFGHRPASDSYAAIGFILWSVSISGASRAIPDDRGRCNCEDAIDDTARARRSRHVGERDPDGEIRAAL